MKKTLLALASLMVAGVAMAADGGTFTFKSYLSAQNNLKVVLSDGSALTADWHMGLVNGSGVLYSSVAGAPVVAGFNLTLPAAAGFVTAGGDWSVAGINQGATADVGLAVWKGDYASGMFKTFSSLYPVTFGGDLAVPTPMVPGKFDFKGQQVLTVAIPEPSVLALGLLGLGAFVARRRS